MSIVDSNSAAPLSYVDATFQSALFVRAKIYDESGGSPVLEGFVNLAYRANGTYRGKYLFTAGKQYNVETMVYTDGTYATVDQTYGQSVNDYQCIDSGSIDISSLATQASVDALQATADTLETDAAADTRSDAILAAVAVGGTVTVRLTEPAVGEVDESGGIEGEID